MKKTITNIKITLLWLLFSMFIKQANAQCNQLTGIVNIPDATFKNYLVSQSTINTNSDGEIQCTEAAAYTGTLNLNSAYFTDLNGIEAFTYLTIIDCHSSSIVNLNVSANAALTTLNCSTNHLQTLYLPSGTTLTTLNCNNNPYLSVLNISACAGLNTLNCSNNTSLTSLNISSNTALAHLECNYIGLSSLNLMSNPALNFLYCIGNNFTSLDLSSNHMLTTLFCYNNFSLSSLNVQNGNNTNMANNAFHAVNNPSLTCIKVDNATWSTANWTGKDAGASFSTNCGNPSISLTGASSLCVGATTTLTPNISGGIWSSISGRATVNSAGVVTGTSGGPATIKYTVGNSYSTKSITVNALPAVPSIAYGINTINPTKAGGFCTNRTINVIGVPSGGVWSKAGVINVTNLGVVTTGTTAGAGSLIYTYTDANGCINSRTMSASVLACAARGISNEPLAMISDFTMYPNPAKTFISLNVETLVGTGQIVVTDLYGKTVKNQALSMGTNTVDIAKLAKGMYFVSTITNEGKTTKKLIVD